MMRSSLSFFILALLLVLLSSTESRLISSTSGQKSHSVASFSADPTAIASPGASSINNDDCSGPGSEECLIRNSMVAHTDYIYTQDVNGP